MATKAVGRNGFERVVEFTRTLPARDRLRLAATVASQHPRLEGKERRLETLLATMSSASAVTEAMGGGPRHVVDLEALAESELQQAQIGGEAAAVVWSLPMLESSAAAAALGAKRTNRERVRQFRERSWLLGLPRDHTFLYPRFQFDRRRRDVFAEVREVNQILGSGRDPWGVASWWVSPNERLGDAPITFVGKSKGDVLKRAAEALVEAVG